MSFKVFLEDTNLNQVLQNFCNNPDDLQALLICADILEDHGYDGNLLRKYYQLTVMWNELNRKKGNNFRRAVYDIINAGINLRDKCIEQEKTKNEMLGKVFFIIYLKIVRMITQARDQIHD